MKNLLLFLFCIPLLASLALAQSTTPTRPSRRPVHENHGQETKKPVVEAKKEVKVIDMKPQGKCYAGPPAGSKLGKPGRTFFRCAAMTKNGKQCRNRALSGSKYCIVHRGKKC